MFKDESAERAHPASEADGLLAVVQGASPVGRGELQPSRDLAAAEMLRAFQSAWLRAVALAWRDPGKLELLKKDPRRFLRSHCDYDLPRDLELTIREAQESPPADQRRWAWDGRREAWCLPGPQITLYVPPPPELAEQAVALAELGDPGKTPPVCC
ncbi:BMA_0021/BMA_0022 family TOMM bacteriocin [Sorangium sp. So ce315]|uniref:BMA_0021/BMA_0022 family TOMM bacteriocin n=1 Tax=Sorangium sp. So ce315 TaxID=3133299 RepID=UPI003F6308AF